ncbi:MAG: 30S ribosomal protein S20 [Armatimonadetes bacterium]|nr:30S ribosomal protein S20 [Armatimonadota bacterium]
MANLKSSKKDLRRIAKRTEQNKGIKSALKTYIKKAKQNAKADVSAPTTEEAIVRAVKALDKAAQNGVIHKNQAARRKSRLMSAINKAKKS